MFRVKKLKNKCFLDSFDCNFDGTPSSNAGFESSSTETLVSDDVLKSCIDYDTKVSQKSPKSDNFSGTEKSLDAKVSVESPKSGSTLDRHDANACDILMFLCR